MAEQKYENLGPIYTTKAKYEAMKAAGTLVVGQEYKLTDWEAQEKLIAGTNITIAADGKTISATGGSSYTAGDGITIDTDNKISVTSGKFVERGTTTADRLVAYQDNTGLQKQIAVVWDGSSNSLTTGEFIATTTSGGNGTITAVNLSDGTTTDTVTNILNKQDKLTAGDNITITDNVISGAAYTVTFEE